MDAAESFENSLWLVLALLLGFRVMEWRFGG
jgi:hypothetical protein